MKTFQALSCVLVAVVVALAQTPIRQWNFEEGSGDSVLEAVSNTRYRIAGTKSWAGGKIGSALVFNGTSTVVNVKKIIPISDSTYTFALWIKSTDAFRYQDIIARDRCFVSPYEWRIYLTGGHLGFYEKDSADQNGNLEPFETSATIPLNTWTHIALTRSHCDYKLYINGTLAASRHSYLTGIADFFIYQPNNPVDMLIGSRWNGDGATVRTEECFAGSMDDVRYYTQALGTAQIAALVNTTTAIAGNSAVLSINHGIRRYTVVTENSRLHGNAMNNVKTWDLRGRPRTTSAAHKRTGVFIMQE